MEIPKIKELCHSQSLYYYDYVKKYSEHNGKTMEKVHSITFQEGSSPLLFEIKLEKSIFDFEKTYFKNNLTNEYYFNKRDIENSISVGDYKLIQKIKEYIQPQLFSI